MHTVLAIETSSELASAALLYRDELISRASSGVQTHSQTLLPMVQSLLAEAGLGLAQCEAIAFGAGPGSFTGVRTACGVAQGLAFGADLPVVPVPTLLAMAQAAYAHSGRKDVLAVLDARMDEVYWAQYCFDVTGNTGQEVIAPRLSKPADVCPQGSVLACGNGFSAYPEAFAASTFSKEALARILPHAAQVAQLAERDVALGRTVSARDAQPVYLRNKVAMTTAERLAKAVV